LADLMRLSLRERRTRGFVQCSVAGNPGRDDKGEGDDSIGHGMAGERTAGPSTPLRSGRDDKEEDGASVWSGWSIPSAAKGSEAEWRDLRFMRAFWPMRGAEQAPAPAFVVRTRCRKDGLEDGLFLA
jgi:hypothetical protein